MMDELERYRKEIEATDAEIAVLFRKRMDAVRNIAAYKQANGLPVTDTNREALLMKNAYEAFRDDEYAPYYSAVYRSFIEASKAYQLDKLQTDAVTVRLSGGSYNVWFGPGMLSAAGSKFDLNRNVMIVTDAGVPAEYAQCVRSQCKNGNIVTVRPGENSKSIYTLDYLISKMHYLGLTRYDAVVAVGGGVVGDLAGFAAACYMRGIDFYNVPTTLLAQVDSCIGGKTAINYNGVKNTVGAFYRPKGVLIDPAVLKTLPEKHMRNGLAEALKTAVICDAKLFDLFENGVIRNENENVIRRCVLIKKQIVETDEKESGLRRTLNFGHTLGHGIEAAQNEPELLHGECVALGMLPMVSAPLRERLENIYGKLGLKTRTRFETDKVLSCIFHDKKKTENGFRCVFSNAPGTYFEKTVSADEMQQLLETVRLG